MSNKFKIDANLKVRNGREKGKSSKFCLCITPEAVRLPSPVTCNHAYLGLAGFEVESLMNALTET